MDEVTGRIAHHGSATFEVEMGADEASGIDGVDGRMEDRGGVGAESESIGVGKVI